MSSNNLKIAQPYAEALLEVFDSESLELLTSDLNKISSILESSKDLRRVISNPILDCQTKKSTLKSIFSEKINIKILNFLLILCDKGRISYLQDITNKCLELAYKSSKVETIELVSSVQITSTQEEALVIKLKQMLGANQIKLNTSVDPELIGGFKLKIQSKIIDTSIKGQLQQLSSHLGASSAT